MYFDGASTQNSAGAGVVLISPSKENIHLVISQDKLFSYEEFNSRNEEYECH